MTASRVLSPYHQSLCPHQCLDVLSLSPVSRREGCPFEDASANAIVNGEKCVHYLFVLIRTSSDVLMAPLQVLGQEPSVSTAGPPRTNPHFTPLH